MAVRRFASDVGEVRAPGVVGSRQLCREKRRKARAKGAFFPANGRGTLVAKHSGMLTLSAFVIALSSVVTSVVWACKTDTPDHV